MTTETVEREEAIGTVAVAGGRADVTVKPFTGLRGRRRVGLCGPGVHGSYASRKAAVAAAKRVYADRDGRWYE